MRLSWKVPKLYFQSQFSMSKINRLKKKILKNINLGNHFFLKEKKTLINLWFYFCLLLKPGPILDGAALCQLTKDITSESIKQRQIEVVIHYCDLSCFFCLRRYNIFIEAHSFFFFFDKSKLLLDTQGLYKKMS